MNPDLQPLFARRSIRRYTDEPVTTDQMHDLLEAAMAAPSACAKDPWRFVVVRQRDMLKAIAAGLPNGGMLAEAAVGVIVCGDMEAAHDGAESYMLQDCSAAIENLLLAASMLGLGACWLGVHPRADRVELIREKLGLPATVVPVSAIAVGQPADQPEARTRYDADYVHHERW